MTKAVLLSVKSEHAANILNLGSDRTRNETTGVVEMKQVIKEHTYYADEMICPYCKHKFTEDYSYEAYGNEYRTDFDYECDECGEVFNVNVDFSVHFISTPYAYTLEEVLGKGRKK